MVKKSTIFYIIYSKIANKHHDWSTKRIRACTRWLYRISKKIGDKEWIRLNELKNL